MVIQHNNPLTSAKNTLGQVRHIHFVGIGGVGMSGIAEVLFNQGYTISGSDISENSMTQRLNSLGVTYFKGHHADHIKGADVIVFSSAVPTSNPELQAAYQQHIPVIPRAQMLAELMRFQYGIAIAGTHGKTTTTSLAASLLAEGGLDPTFVIGGQVTQFGSNARLGKSTYFITEADESDASFLHLQPMLAVVTNIDEEHLTAYDNNFDNLCQGFLKFLHHLPFYGTAILCIDDPTIKNLLPHVSRPVITYGFDETADVRPLTCEHQGLKTRLSIQRQPPFGHLNVTLNSPGRHTILNALAAITVASVCGVSDAAIENGLATFSGIGRRFQLHGDYRLNGKLITLIDDYGHHPSEIAAVLQTIRQVWPKRRVIIVFQPHRYSRTESLFEQFVAVLSQVDKLFLLDIFSAGEAPIAGISSRSLCRAIRERKQVEPVLAENTHALSALIETTVEAGDIVLTQGAGNIGQLIKQWANTWQRQRNTKVD